MPDTKSKSQHKKTNGKRGSLKLRSAVLILQILLPFGLYYALKCGNQVAAGLVAGIFTLSMIMVVWFG